MLTHPAPLKGFFGGMETRYGIPDFIVKASSQLCSVHTPQQTNQTTPYIVTGAQLSLKKECYF